ncbi:TPA: serine/threonine protein kinase [Trebouxia sp. C0006]
MFLEFAQGGDLKCWLVKRRESAGIPAMHLFQPLRELHALNIVHNGVKPHNCLLKRQDNCLKLAHLANSVQLQTGLPGAQFEVAPKGIEAYMALSD